MMGENTSDSMTTCWKILKLPPPPPPIYPHVHPQGCAPVTSMGPRGHKVSTKIIVLTAGQDWHCLMQQQRKYWCNAQQWCHKTQMMSPGRKVLSQSYDVHGWPIRIFPVWPIRIFPVWPFRIFPVWPIRIFPAWPIRISGVQEGG